MRKTQPKRAGRRGLGRGASANIQCVYGHKQRDGKTHNRKEGKVGGRGQNTSIYFAGEWRRTQGRGEGQTNNVLSEKV